MTFCIIRHFTLFVNNIFKFDFTFFIRYNIL
nr:MAG TPA: hypothetical protein [Caudoviricetes sp.]